MKQALVVLFLLFSFNVYSIASIPVRNAMESESESAKFFNLVAEKKVGQDEFNLFLKYLNGNGVSENQKLANEWCIKSAELGHELAQYFLGLTYYEGDFIIPENKKIAVKWFRKAAEQGSTGAQSYLGYMYSKGEGVTVDNKYASAWYSVQLALKYSEVTQRQRDAIANTLSPPGLEEAQDIANKLFDKININK
jgi:TPR repeat protein